MCKVEVCLDLLRPLEAREHELLSRAHSIYGLLRVTPEGSARTLRVVYDATRLSGEQLVSELRRLGLPVSPPIRGAAPSPA